MKGWRIALFITVALTAWARRHLEARLDSTRAQTLLRTRLRGVREVLA